jgi:receptor protein-tyrosine kinase/non-specific protein-tyrosine kinase
MDQTPDTRPLRDYLRILRERRVLIIGAVTTAIAVALGYAAIKTPEYEATATISYKNPQEDLAFAGTAIGPQLQPEKAAAANARLVSRDDVVERVRNGLDSDRSIDQIRDSITTEVEPDSFLIGITASAEDAEEAAALANEFAAETEIVARKEARETFRTDAKRLAERLDDRAAQSEAPPLAALATQDSVSRLITLSTVADPVDITRSAEEPGSPASPQPIRDSLIAAALGLILGVGAAFLRHSLDRRLTDAREVQHEVGLPLVGYVRSDTLGMVGLSANGRFQVSEDDLEGFRILRANVDFLTKDRDLSSLVVTSALPEEGKTTVASWYAYASAIAGRSTLLLECDFRRPTMAKRLGLDPAPGLSDFLLGNAKPKEVLRTVAVEGPHAVETLPVIPAGAGAFEAAEMLGSETFEVFLDQVTRAYDVVIIDSAPLLPVGDTLELLPLADGLLLCVRIDQTTRDHAIAARQAIDHAGDKPKGLVVTGVRPGSEYDYYGYYSYREPAAA